MRTKLIITLDLTKDAVDFWEQIKEVDTVLCKQQLRNLGIKDYLAGSKYICHTQRQLKYIYVHGA